MYEAAPVVYLETYWMHMFNQMASRMPHAVRE
jgi:hypothetical protein